AEVRHLGRALAAQREGAVVQRVVGHSVRDEETWTHAVGSRLSYNAMSTTEPKLHPPARHTTEHWARVRREVAQTLDEVPLYAGRAAPPDGDSPEQVSAWLA